MSHRVAIIGSGPAGYTAALYAARANLSPVLFEGHEPGGQLMITTEVENFPGFPEGLQGPELMQLFRKQAERFGTRIISDHIVRVDFSARPFRMWDTSDGLHEADAVIISTGATAMWLGLESEKTFSGKGVSACATCDGFFFRGKDVAVVGGGDTAMEEALFLSNLCSSVTVIHRRGELRASKIMQQRALENPKIRFVWNSVVDEILGDAAGLVGAVRVRHVDTGDCQDIPLQGIFIAIGHRPNTELFRGQLQLDDKGYIQTREGTRTNLEGVFAAGDVQDSIYRQAITAAGTGCMAAIDAERWLAGTSHGQAAHAG
ncbi:MAG: thioredoxin-disulfide reductase [bacterium]|nr:thioredoxin-disulfide reductase [bacterium]